MWWRITDGIGTLINVPTRRLVLFRTRRKATAFLLSLKMGREATAVEILQGDCSYLCKKLKMNGMMVDPSSRHIRPDLIGQARAIFRLQ